MLQVTDQIAIPLEELVFTFSRSSGPGGQNVNKVNSKVTLHWDVTRSASIPDGVRERFLVQYATRINSKGELVLTSQRHRDQLQNRQECLDKLVRLIQAVAAAPRRRRRTRPTRVSKQRRLQAKRRLSEKKRMRRHVPSESD